MKYVRTKDGIYEVKCETDITYELNTQSMLYRVYKSEVIKPADTIEELCDEFVAFENGFLRPSLEFKNIDKSVLDAFIHCAKIECPNAELFGSIWTKKGLIHVAKISEKGELELL